MWLGSTPLPLERISSDREHARQHRRRNREVGQGGQARGHQGGLIACELLNELDAAKRAGAGFLSLKRYCCRHTMVRLFGRLT
jgi:hypothetical protein